uniref:Uncharacterized protein n=1 Tax=Avena sativa TaxID=4498 RepID=A0ACD5YPS4_AVESA
MAPLQRPTPTPPTPSHHTPAATPPPPPPGPPRVILSHTVEMAEAEDVLRLAMVASITGTRPRVAISAVERLLCSHFKLHPDDFTVHLHHPEDFFLTFHSKTAYDCIAGDHFLNDANFCFSVRPWCKLAHAKLGRMDYHVKLELRGIPAHAWHVSTTEHLLGGSCWIERLHPGTSRSGSSAPSSTTATHQTTLVRAPAVMEMVLEGEATAHPTLALALATSDPAVMDASDAARTSLRQAAPTAWPRIPSGGGAPVLAALTGWPATPTGPRITAPPRWCSSPEPARWRHGASVGPVASVADREKRKGDRPRRFLPKFGASKLSASHQPRLPLPRRLDHPVRSPHQLDHRPLSFPPVLPCGPVRRFKPLLPCRLRSTDKPRIGSSARQRLTPEHGTRNPRPDRAALASGAPKADHLSGPIGVSGPADDTLACPPHGASLEPQDSPSASLESVPATVPQLSILQRPESPCTPRPSSTPTTSPPAGHASRNVTTLTRSSPRLVYKRRQRASAPAPVGPWTLGSFLDAATKQINPILPTPAKKQRKSQINFTPRRGRSVEKSTAPPTAERRAQVQLMRNLGIVGVDQEITEVEMKASADVFAMPISLPVLTAIAALLVHMLPNEILQADLIVV